MIRKTVQFGTHWPNTNGQEIAQKYELVFPEGEITWEECNERGSTYMVPTLKLQCPFLKFPVHFQFDGLQLDYFLFGMNEIQLASHPQKAQIDDWLEEQIIKFKSISSKEP